MGIFDEIVAEIKSHASASGVITALGINGLSKKKPAIATDFSDSRKSLPPISPNNDAGFSAAQQTCRLYTYCWKIEERGGGGLPTPKPPLPGYNSSRVCKSATSQAKENGNTELAHGTLSEKSGGESAGLSVEKPVVIAFRPGDQLPPWVVEVLSSFPDLPQEWWESEDFQLAAAGLGITGRPVPQPEIAISRQDEALLGQWWGFMAADILSGLEPLTPSSRLGSIEIGLRSCSYLPDCAAAYRKIQESRNPPEPGPETPRLFVKASKPNIEPMFGGTILSPIAQ